MDVRAVGLLITAWKTINKLGRMTLISPQNDNLCPVCSGSQFHNLFPQYTGRCITSQMQPIDNLTFDNRCCLNCGFIFNAKGTREISKTLYTTECWKPKPQVMSFEKDAKGQQERALDIFSGLYTFPEKGCILDFGAGTGRFLEYFHLKFPQWKLYGIEPGNGYMEHKARIPQAISYNKPYYDICLPQKMDVIVVMSVLEHVENPLHALHWIANNLSNDGIVLLQHPNFASLPGDLFCIDHIGKLTVPHTKSMCEHAGLKIEKIQQRGVFFSLSCIKNTKKELKSVVQENLNISANAECLAKATVQCVEAAITKAQNSGGKAAVFGTSPIGYMAPKLLGQDKAIICFVDENPNTWGREQDGIPIVAPAQMAMFGISDLALAISPVYWKQVAEKMRAFGVRVYIPSFPL